MICVIMLIVPLISACSSQERKSVSRTFFMFEAVLEVKIYDTDDETLLDKCKTFLERYEDVFSANRSTSELYKINNSSDTVCEISKDIYEVTERSLKICEMTDGRFDITVRPVSKLYDFRAESFAPPTEEEIKKALENVSYRNISVKEENGKYYLYRKNSGVQLDLGAVSKGYISDKLKEYLIGLGVESALIDLGGNMMCVGGNKDGDEVRDFKIGIFDPTDPEGKDPIVVDVRDCCVITSGIYQRNAQYGGKTYHHILDARKGVPAEGEVESVSIVCKEGIMGDMLSTALFLLYEEGIKAELPEDTGVMCLYKDGSREYDGIFEDMLR